MRRAARPFAKRAVAVGSYTCTRDKGTGLVDVVAAARKLGAT